MSKLFWTAVGVGGTVFVISQFNKGKQEKTAFRRFGDSLNERLVPGEDTLGTFLFDVMNTDSGTPLTGLAAIEKGSRFGQEQFKQLIDSDFESINPTSPNNFVNQGVERLIPGDNTVGGFIFDSTQRVKALFGDDQAQRYVREYLE